jgi:type IV pilus assembly protein PilC
MLEKALSTARKWLTAVPRRSVALFFSNMAVLLETGVSISRSVDLLADQETHPRFKEVLLEVGRAIDWGSPLSKALSAHTPPFHLLHVGMVRAGEAGGNLPTVLGRLAHIGEKEIALVGRVRAICTYPALVLAISMVMLFSVSQLLTRSFLPVLAASGVQLPFLTRVIVWLASPIGIALSLALAIALGVAFYRWLRTAEGRDWLAAISLTIPLLGPALLRVELSRSLRLLAGLYNSGVPILNAFDIVVEATPHLAIRRALAQVAARVRNGIPLDRAFFSAGLFPPAVAHFAAVGEESGALANMLDKLSDFYEFEVENTLDNLAAALEPLLIATMGVFVGVVVIIAFGPLMQLAAKLGS